MIRTQEIIKRQEKNRKSNYGFTLIEILISVAILSLGILMVSQMTILGQRSNRVIKHYMEAREVLARGMEVLKILNIDDPLLHRTCTYTALDSIALANQADASNIVGQTIGPTVYEVYWNVADSVPSVDYKTIRMMVVKNENIGGVMRDHQLIAADYVRWEE